jgi:hypothetical protein
MSIKNSFQGGKKPCNHFSFVNKEVHNCLIPLVILLCLAVALPSQGEPFKRWLSKIHAQDWGLATISWYKYELLADEYLSCHSYMQIVRLPVRLVVFALFSLEVNLTSCSPKALVAYFCAFVVWLIRDFVFYHDSYMYTGCMQMRNVYQLFYKQTLDFLSSKLATSPSWWIWKELQSWISFSWCLIWI